MLRGSLTSPNLTTIRSVQYNLHQVTLIIDITGTRANSTAGTNPASYCDKDERESCPEQIIQNDQYRVVGDAPCDSSSRPKTALNRICYRKGKPDLSCVLIHGRRNAYE